MLTYFTGEVGNQKYGNKCKARVQKHGKEESNVRKPLYLSEGKGGKTSYKNAGFG